MLRVTSILFLFAVGIAAGNLIKSNRHDVRKFPDGFMFGAATASYQVEGAWDEDGKSESIWDHLTHNYPDAIKDGSNGDIADDSYHQIERDVEIMRELGLDYYRISLSWPRILPTSFPDFVNEAGLQYYKNLIDEMLKYNIQPMVTLYHWDLPQKLQELGGWANPHIVDWFEDYARTVFEHLGDRVKYWITMNEPYIVCMFGYGDVNMAPRVNQSGVADYMCTKNLLMAHARAYHVYNEEFRTLQGGTIGITLNADWHEPESEEHAEAAIEALQFEFGIFAHPIYSETGDFPPVVKQRVAAHSAAQGLPRSRLPEFTQEEIEYVRGTSDFFGLNHYSTSYNYRNDSVQEVYSTPSYSADRGVISYQLSEWKIGESDFTKFVPWGFYKLLVWIKDSYNNPEIFITENGFATYGGLDDEDRTTYYKYYLDALLDAIDDGVDITMYTAWSIMDNFEWMQGYTESFGLYEVDYSDPKRTRTPRKSAFFYKELLRTRALDLDYEPPANAVMTIDEGH